MPWCLFWKKKNPSSLSKQLLVRGRQATSIFLKKNVKEKLRKIMPYIALKQ